MTVETTHITGTQKGRWRSCLSLMVWTVGLTIALLTTGALFVVLSSYYDRWSVVSFRMNQATQQSYHQLFGGALFDHSPVTIDRPLLTSFQESIWEIRVVTTLELLPPALIEAVLAAEDGSFYQHPGIDIRGIVRAVWVNLRRGSVSQGGSTITQQLVKSFIKRQGRAWLDKAMEAVLSLHLELSYSKDAILSAYLNTVYMGHIGPFELHGMSAASRYLFGREIGDLQPGECAMLAAMIRSPNSPSLMKDKEGILLQSVRVLNLMKERGRLSSDYIFQPEDGWELAGKLTGNRLLDMAWIWQEVERELRVYHLNIAKCRERIVIAISVDSFMQQQAALILETHLGRLAQLQKKPVVLQGAMAVVDQRTGAVKVVVGGRDYLKSQFNRATMAERSIGSLVKPFVYLAAMSQEVEGGKIGPATLVDDTPMRIQTSSGPWQPLNFDRFYRGTITLEEALIASRNVPAVRIGLKASAERVVELIRKVGIDDAPQPLPALFLGACSSNVWRMVAAYSAIGRNGAMIPPSLIDAVTVGGSVNMMRRPALVQVLDKEHSKIMSGMLAKALAIGTGKSAAGLGIGSAAAGKTGTSSDMRDAWFAGYSPSLSTVVWVGNDENIPIDLTGAQAALPIWAEFMRDFGETDMPQFDPESPVPKKSNIQMVSNPQQRVQEMPPEPLGLLEKTAKQNAKGQTMVVPMVTQNAAFTLSETQRWSKKGDHGFD